MLLGQWGHGYPEDVKGDEYDEQIVAWFDHYLRGGPRTVPNGVVEYQDDLDGWHTTDRWPPAATEVTLYLSDGALVTSPEEVAASEQTFVGQSIDPGPFDCPGTQAVYVSPPLAEDVEIAGNFLVNLTVESTLPNGNFGVFLYHVEDVAPCSEKLSDLDRLSSDITPAWPGEVRRALSDLRHRGGALEEGEDFPVGGSDVMRMTSHPFASSAKAGERLVVAVSGGSGELTPRADTPILTVITGSGVEGQITIPVVSGTLRFEG
jgi:predicted acyl esterase